MKIQKAKSKRYPIYVGISLLVALIIAPFAWSFATTGSPLFWEGTSDTSNTVDLNEATDEQREAGEITKQNAITPSSENKPSTGGSDPLTPPKTSEGSKGEVAVSITAANQTADALQVRVLISAFAATGSCSLSINGNGTTVTRQVETQALANSMTCKGFDIPLSELPDGRYEVTITFESTDYTGKTSKTINVT